MVFSGEMVIASTGQYIRHKWQIWQSSGYKISAFLESGFNLNTSVGQLLIHSSHPMQPFILSIDIIFCFSMMLLLFQEQSKRTYHGFKKGINYLKEFVNQRGNIIYKRNKKRPAGYFKPVGLQLTNSTNKFLFGNYLTLIRCADTLYRL